jgi:integrase
MSSSILRNAALQPATLRVYDKNLRLFLQHTRHSLQQLLSLPATRIDSLFSVFLEYQFSIGGSFDSASHAFNSLIFRSPALRHQLGESRLRLRGWSRLKRSASHPPITWELTVVFAVTMAKWHSYPHAVATLLAFDCYLRVGELTRLRYCDVVQPSDPRVGAAHTSMALRLARTKTGNNQWVSVQTLSVAQVLQQYLQSRPFSSSALLFPFTPAQYRTLLRSVSASLGVGHIPYVPHSFRHGGATADYLRGHSIEHIMFRGRWKSMESARRYIQTGRALLVTLELPQQLHATGQLLGTEIAAVLSALSSSASPRSTRRVHFQPGC